MSSGEQALTGLRVLDMSRILAGPWCTQNLADMGADVIKIERPSVGDDSRAWGPPFLRDSEGRETYDSSYFLSANRGKRSVAIDISKPEGQAIIRRIAAQSDILIENYKVGTLARYGLAYEDIRKVKPDIIYCSVSGFGQSGPYAHLPGYDFVFQGMGGLMDITGNPDDAPGGGPMKVGIAIADILSGMYATTAILGALEFRRRTGKGQYIDVALLDCVVAATSYLSMNYFIGGRLPARFGNGHQNLVPYQVFAAADGNIILAVGNDSQFQSFCRVAQRPELAEDPKFATVANRVRNRDELLPIVAGIMRGRTMQEWMVLLSDNNVPCGPIYRLDQVYADPQVRHRGMRIEVPHGAGVNAPHVASPINYSESAIAYSRSAPTLGEHTREVLSDFGLAGDEIARLDEAGIVQLGAG